jgi:hypothetical protein
MAQPPSGQIACGQLSKVGSGNVRNDIKLGVAITPAKLVPGVVGTTVQAHGPAPHNNLPTIVQGSSSVFLGPDKIPLAYDGCLVSCGDVVTSQPHDSDIFVGP